MDVVVVSVWPPLDVDRPSVPGEIGKAQERISAIERETPLSLGSEEWFITAPHPEASLAGDESTPVPLVGGCMIVDAVAITTEPVDGDLEVHILRNGLALEASIVVADGESESPLTAVGAAVGTFGVERLQFQVDDTNDGGGAYGAWCVMLRMK